MTERELIEALAEDVKTAGGRMYYVGGSVRDGCLGRAAEDLDCEVYGIDWAGCEAILSRFGHVHKKGKKYPVLGLEHHSFDISIPHDESGNIIKLTKEGCRRRDFTINAMMRDVLDGHTIDFYGGMEDLEKRTLRMVDQVTFTADALRVFRAARFCACLRFEITPDTMALCRKIHLEDIARERVYEELKKALLMSDKPSLFFTTLCQMGHLQEWFPEVDALIGVPQSPVFHPEGDVFTHTMMVLDEAAGLRQKAENPLGFMLSALCHDFGKAAATFEKNGKIHAYGHENQGLPLVEAFFRRFGVKNEEPHVKNMVKNHMRPNQMARSGSKLRKTRSMFDASICPEDLILLARADAQGCGREPDYQKASQYLEERFKDYQKRVGEPMVTGQDLLKLGYAPDNRMGEIVKRCRELHFANFSKDEVMKLVLKEFPIGNH